VEVPCDKMTKVSEKEVLWETINGKNKLLLFVLFHFQILSNITLFPIIESLMFQLSLINTIHTFTFNPILSPIPQFSWPNYLERTGTDRRKQNLFL